MTLEIPAKIETHVVIREVLNHRLAKATLPNGKEVHAFIDLHSELFPIVEGSSMAVRMDVADFSRAELTGK